jgi:hypothetical protein
MGMNVNHMVTSSLQRQLNQIVIQMNEKKDVEVEPRLLDDVA